MQFGERRAEKQGHTKRICFEHGCDPQTHQDDTNHTRRRTMHILSSQKTPEGTGAWWGVQLGGRCAFLRMAKDGHTPPLLWSTGPSLTYSREIEHQSSTLITYGEVIYRSRWTHGVRKRQTVPNFIGPREAEKEGSQNRGCEPPDEQEQRYPDEKLVHTY